MLDMAVLCDRVTFVYKIMLQFHCHCSVEVDVDVDVDGSCHLLSHFKDAMVTMETERRSIRGKFSSFIIFLWVDAVRY